LPADRIPPCHSLPPWRISKRGAIGLILADNCVPSMAGNTVNRTGGNSLGSLMSQPRALPRTKPVEGIRQIMAGFPGTSIRSRSADSSVKGAEPFMVCQAEWNAGQVRPTKPYGARKRKISWVAGVPNCPDLIKFASQPYYPILPNCLSSSCLENTNAVGRPWGQWWVSLARWRISSRASINSGLNRSPARTAEWQAIRLITS